MAISGDVKSLIQANNGDVLAGTNNSARIYRSLDNGQTFSQIIALGSATDSVNAFAKVESSGYILAAVTGSSGAQGIWRSLDNGATWTRVRTHPNSLGFWDITAIQGSGRLVAVGPGVTVGSTSPIVYSGDQGATWSYVSTPHFTHPYTSVAAYLDSPLFTQYPQEQFGNVFTFIGSDTYYTGMFGVGLVGVTPTFYEFSTFGIGAGNGGLDMASFLYKNSFGSFYRQTLWAVRSALNTADTEIWKWPAGSYQSGSVYFDKLATIPGENFCALYVDPIFDWQDIGALRTIWAGSDGKIWVSYNNGYTWAVATTTPVGTICSFVRTSSGVLIAGGEAGEIFLFGGSGSEGGGGEEEEPPVDPEDPDDPGIVTSRFLGRNATCDNEVVISNKVSYSNVTHIFYYDGSTYNNLQFSAIPPYELLGATAVVNKAAYFGSKTNDSNVPGGTFSSLVFDITQISANITVVWEYWNGAAWVSLTTQDNTDQFRILGVLSVSWQIPSAWTIVAVNGITGYWIRARISAVAASPQTPIHGNRYIYTSLLPYVEISASEIQGDLPAIGRIKWYNQSGIDAERVICGLRSLDRGSNFNAFINISDIQSPFGLIISKGSEVGSDWQDDKVAPSNRSLLVSYTVAGDLNDWNDLATITLSTTVAGEYHGYYRALLRCFYNNAAVSAWNLRIQLRFGSGGTRLNTQTVYPNSLSNWEAVDFGQLAISTRQNSSQAGSLADEMKIVIQGYCTTLSRPLTLYDLILIPIDEWAVDTRIPDLDATGSPEIDVYDYLDIDSITNPKIAISAYNRNPAGLIVSKYQAINNGPVILQKNKDQRLWFFNLTYENYWRGYPEALGSVQVYKQQQYLGFRGTR